MRKARHGWASPQGPWPSTPFATTGLAVVLGLMAAAGLWLHVSQTPLGQERAPTLAVNPSVQVAPPGNGSPADERFRQGVLGTWQDFYHGKRTLAIRPDGTATMLVELSGWKARLFTPRLRLEMVWAVEDGKLKRRTVGGEPADKVEYVNRRAGDRCAETILQLTADRMLLLDQNGQQQYDWRRVR